MIENNCPPLHDGLASVAVHFVGERVQLVLKAGQLPRFAEALSASRLADSFAPSVDVCPAFVAPFYTRMYRHTHLYCPHLFHETCTRSGPR